MTRQLPLVIQLRRVLPARDGYKHDVQTVGYSEREATWRRGYCRIPDRRFKYVMLNCYRYRVEWLPDLHLPKLEEAAQ